MKDMQKTLEKTDYRFLNKSHIMTTNVEYSKGQVLDTDPEEAACCELAAYQKPPDFKPEQEFRIIILLSHLDPLEQIPEYVKLDFGKRIDYASMCWSSHNISTGRPLYACIADGNAIMTEPVPRTTP